MSTQTFTFDPERHLFTVNGERRYSVTQVLSKAGLCDWSYVEEELRLHSLARGQSVHWLTRLEDEAALNYRTVPKRLRGYRKAWQRWKVNSGFHPILIEHPFVSDYGYAGIVDRAGWFPPTTMQGATSFGVVDIKTGDVQDHVRYQLVAYTVGIQPDIRQAEYIRRVAVRLQADGTYKVKEYPLCTWLLDWGKFYHKFREVQKDGERAGNRTEAGIERDRIGSDGEDHRPTQL